MGCGASNAETISKSPKKQSKVLSRNASLDKRMSPSKNEGPSNVLN